MLPVDLLVCYNLAATPTQMTYKAFFAIFVMRLYVDTNVFLDYFWPYRKHHKEAADFFVRVLKEKHVLIVSNWTLMELDKYVTPMQYQMLFTFLEKVTEVIQYSEKDIEEAKRISPEHFQDALHGILAHKAKSDFVVSRDSSGFTCVRHLVEAKLPEQVFI